MGGDTLMCSLHTQRLHQLIVDEAARGTQLLGRGLTDEVECSCFFQKDLDYRCMIGIIYIYIYNGVYIYIDWNEFE